MNRHKKVCEEVHFLSDTNFKGALSITTYMLDAAGDSIRVLSKELAPEIYNKGVNDIKIIFSPSDTNTFIHHNLYEILNITGNVPPGSYKTYLLIKVGNYNITSIHLNQVDSLLSANSPVRTQVNNKLLPKNKFINPNIPPANGYAKKLFLSEGKLKRALKFKNLTSFKYDKEDKTYVDFYYKDWFAGRYILDKKQNLTSQLNSQAKGASNSLNSIVPNDLDDGQSLFSKFRTIKQAKKDNEDMVGEISLTTNVSNGQEQYSGTDNNYYELNAHVEVPVMDMPIDVEGYYTSQDNHREIKSSYLHIHYDVDKAKSQLTSLMSNYNQKYAEIRSKGTGLDQVYGNYIAKLQSQKTLLQGEINSQAAGLNSGQQTNLLNSNGMQGTLTNTLQKAETSGMQQLQKDTTQLKNKINAKVESNNPMPQATGDEAKTQDSIAAKKQKLAALNARLKKVEQAIQKYQQLLLQYKNTTYFDSVAGANKLQHLNYSEEASYKDLAKQESNLLPDGKAKTFVAGITNFDAGMFPKEQSAFTMSGQMMKGVDFGYDFSLFKEGITLGKTQYIGADGNVDQYTCYSSKTTFKTYKKQQLSFIYYGYTVDKKMMASDKFFKDANVSAPSFFRPVNVLSLDYKGIITKYVRINAEAATSIYQAPSDSNISKNNKAYHVDVDASIPRSTIAVVGSYDNAGKGFQNSTLPILPSGTTEYKLAVNGIFFKKVLSAGIEYDHFVQNNYAYVGVNNKWGFNVKFNNKKYPSASLSYKPFTTFTSYTDTLNVPQRPLIGAVWAGKLSYRIKKEGNRSFNFSIIYNNSTSSADSTHYSNYLLQAMCTYNSNNTMLSASLANIVQTGVNTGIITTAPTNMYQLSMMGSYMLTKQAGINCGQDIGLTSFGFCKYAINAGIMYRPDKQPITIRASLRYTTYKLAAGEARQQIYSGYFEISWRFKTKILSKPNL